MKLSDFLFNLPDELIAQTPSPQRGDSRLLVVDRGRKALEHRVFSDLPEILRAGDCVVANDSKVLDGRFYGHRLLGEEMGGKVEIVILEALESLLQYRCLMKSSFKRTVGQKLVLKDRLGDRLGALIAAIGDGTVDLIFDRPPFETGGWMPLPPYIRPTAESDALARERYQTVYADTAGSIAAPTAGLHFTPAILERLRERGVDWQTVTLHVGYGTFRPIEAEDITKHSMHEESYELSDATAATIVRTKAAGGRCVAVGTTAARVLETVFRKQKNQDRLESGVPLALSGDRGRTRLFLYPGEKPGFGVVDALITNFHLPGSSLFVLVCALAGTELMKAAYAEAIRARYRFYSYGDAMIIL